MHDTHWERQQNDSGGGKLMQHPLTLLSDLLGFLLTFS